MFVKGGEIEVVALSEGVSPRKTSSPQIRGKIMDGIRKRSKPPGKDTPKRDRYGEDDEPL